MNYAHFMRSAVIALCISAPALQAGDFSWSLSGILWKLTSNTAQYAFTQTGNAVGYLAGQVKKTAKKTAYVFGPGAVIWPHFKNSRYPTLRKAAAIGIAAYQLNALQEQQHQATRDHFTRELQQHSDRIIAEVHDVRDNHNSRFNNLDMHNNEFDRQLKSFRRDHEQRHSQAEEHNEKRAQELRALADRHAATAQAHAAAMESRLKDHADSAAKKTSVKLDRFSTDIQSRVDNGFTTVNNHIDDLGRNVRNIRNDMLTAQRLLEQQNKANEDRNVHRHNETQRSIQGLTTALIAGLNPKAALTASSTSSTTPYRPAQAIVSLSSHSAQASPSSMLTTIHGFTPEPLETWQNDGLDSVLDNALTMFDEDTRSKVIPNPATSMRLLLPNQ